MDIIQGLTNDIANLDLSKLSREELIKLKFKMTKLRLKIMHEIENRDKESSLQDKLKELSLQDKLSDPENQIFYIDEWSISLYSDMNKNLPLYCIKGIWYRDEDLHYKHSHFQYTAGLESVIESDGTFYTHDNKFIKLLKPNKQFIKDVQEFGKIELSEYDYDENVNKIEEMAKLEYRKVAKYCKIHPDCLDLTDYDDINPVIDSGIHIIVNFLFTDLKEIATAEIKFMRDLGSGKLESWNRLGNKYYYHYTNSFGQKKVRTIYEYNQKVYYEDNIKHCNHKHEMIDNRTPRILIT
jgi:hypothetical protein